MPKRLAEAPRSIAKKEIAGQQVEFAVAVEVAERGHAERESSMALHEPTVRRPAERALLIEEEDVALVLRQRPGIQVVREYHVEVAVPVDVPHQSPPMEAAFSWRPGGVSDEAPTRTPPQESRPEPIAPPDDQVQAPVAIQVTGGERGGVPEIGQHSLPGLPERRLRRHGGRQSESERGAERAVAWVLAGHADLIGTPRVSC